MTKVLGGVLAKAPVKPNARVLGIATGTGIWAIEFGISSPPPRPPSVLSNPP